MHLPRNRSLITNCCITEIITKTRKVSIYPLRYLKLRSGRKNKTESWAWKKFQGCFPQYQVPMGPHGIHDLNLRAISVSYFLVYMNLHGPPNNPSVIFCSPQQLLMELPPPPSQLQLHFREPMSVTFSSLFTTHDFLFFISFYFHWKPDEKIFTPISIGLLLPFCLFFTFWVKPTNHVSME